MWGGRTFVEECRTARQYKAQSRTVENRREENRGEESWAVAEQFKRSALHSSIQHSQPDIGATAQHSTSLQRCSVHSVVFFLSREAEFHSVLLSWVGLGWVRFAWSRVNRIAVQPCFSLRWLIGVLSLSLPPVATSLTLLFYTTLLLL